MRTMRRFVVVGCSGVVLAICLACSKGGGTASSGNAVQTSPPSAGPPANAPQPMAQPATPTLPPEPAPTLAGRAADVPGLEATLAGDQAYQGMWTPGRRRDLDAFLTALSQALAGTAAGSTNIDVDQSLVTPLQRAHLDSALITMVSIFGRQGRYAADFMQRTQAHLDAIRSEPNLGVWRPTRPGQPPYDCAALAFWMHRDRPEYAREFIAAKRDAIRWAPVRNPERPYLNRERAALEWLARLTTLDATEAARLQELQASRLGDDPADEVAIQTLLREYRDNEVRADAQYRGHVVQFTGTVDRVARDITESIYATVGTGRGLEVPVVQCFFDDRLTRRAAMLNGGQRVTLRGRVDGLMMNVLVRDCEFTD